MIKKAYDLSCQLFAGRFQYSGKDFICHNVGTASVLCILNQPAEVIAAGLLHNAYGTGTFGSQNNNTESKRKYILEKLDKKIEQYIYGFHKLCYNHKRHWRKTFLQNPKSVLSASDVEKKTMLILLADMLEHNIDKGILYNCNYEEERNFLKNNGISLVKIAQILDYPILAEELEKVFNNSINNQIKNVFREQKYNNFSDVKIPRSYRKKLFVLLYEKIDTNIQILKKQSNQKLKKIKRKIRRKLRVTAKRFNLI